MDSTHCGVDGFSPQSPDCQANIIPEPGTLVLVLIALVVWRTVRRVAARSWRGPEATS